MDEKGGRGKRGARGKGKEDVKEMKSATRSIQSAYLLALAHAIATLPTTQAIWLLLVLPRVAPPPLVLLLPSFCFFRTIFY